MYCCIACTACVNTTCTAVLPVLHASTLHVLLYRWYRRGQYCMYCCAACTACAAVSPVLQGSVLHVLLYRRYRRGQYCMDGSIPDFFAGNCDILSADAVIFDYFDDPQLKRGGRMDMLKLKP